MMNTSYLKNALALSHLPRPTGAGFRAKREIFTEYNKDFPWHRPPGRCQSLRSFEHRPEAVSLREWHFWDEFYFQ